MSVYDDIRPQPPSVIIYLASRSRKGETILAAHPSAIKARGWKRQSACHQDRVYEPVSVQRIIALDAKLSAIFDRIVEISDKCAVHLMAECHWICPRHNDAVKAMQKLLSMLAWAERVRR